ncbi:ATP-binding cassette domain-containing protein [Thermodesulfobacteriota bacterium]
MRELLNRLKAVPGLSFQLLLSSFFISLLALSSPMFVILVLNRYVTHGVDSTLVTLTTGVIIAIVLEFGFRQVRLKFAEGISVRPDAQLAGGAFATLTSAKMGAIERMPPGLRREIMGGLSSVQQAYSPTNISTVMDVLFAFMYIIVLFMLNTTIAVIVTFFLVFMFFFALVAHGMLDKPMQDLNQASVRNNALVGSAMLATDSVRSFNASRFLKEIWGKQQALTNNLRKKITAQQGFSQSVTTSVSAIMTVAVIGVGATIVVAGNMSVGVMIGFNILASRALAPISRFALLGSVFTRAQHSLDLLEKFARLPREETKGSALKHYTGRLEFKDLAFMYQGSSGPLFESTSLEITPGKLLVITGNNGSGKTTIARLIIGLLEPTRGQILVDGLDLRQVMPEWWRKQVVYLPQEPTFFDGTIRENLMTLRPEMDEAVLMKKIERAGLKQFLDESPDGLETMLVNGGVNLALGIRRRLALARALTSNGMLAVFDEPAEGLDGEGAGIVFRVMSDFLRNGRALVVCSHNPNILQGNGIKLDLNKKPVPGLDIYYSVRPGNKE